MANKINIRIDVKKLTKSKFTPNEYKKRDGTEVSELNADLVIIEKKEPRLIKETDDWQLKETHFVVEKGDKDEEPNYVGVGTQFFNKGLTEEQKAEIKAVREQAQASADDEPTISLEDLPF